MAETQVWYVYGIVRDGFDLARAPAGLDDVPVALARTGTIAALVSRLPASSYSGPAIESQSADVSWLSPRAMAHDRVLTWAQDHGGVIPLPMFSLWGSEAALAKTLSERAADLGRVFARVEGADEFGLRVHRRDAEMLKVIDQVDPALASLRRDADAATPGQRYLLQKKLEEQAKTAMRAASQRMAQEIFDALRSVARSALQRPIVPTAGGAQAGDATMVLNGAFLVDRARADAFREAVGARVREYQPRGLTFDFTGPWPPYNFVAEGAPLGGRDT